MPQSVVNCPKESLSIDLDVTISLSRPQTEIATDLTLLAFCSPDLPESFTPDAGRVKLYSTSKAALADVEPNSPAYFAINAFFARDDRPSRMAIARIFEEPVAGRLTGAALQPSDIAALKEITDGSFSIEIDGSAQKVQNLNFSSATDAAGVASVLDSAMTGATVTATESGALVITSDVAGDGSSVSVATEAENPQDATHTTLTGGTLPTPATTKTNATILSGAISDFVAIAAKTNATFSWKVSGADRSYGPVDMTGTGSVDDIVAKLHSVSKSEFTATKSGTDKVLITFTAQGTEATVEDPTTDADGVDALIMCTVATGATYTNGTTTTRVEEFEELDAATLTITVDEQQYALTALDLTKCIDAEDVVNVLKAAAAPAGRRKARAAAADLPVTAVGNRLVFTSPTAGSGGTVSYATGTAAEALKLTQAAGAQIVQGVESSTPETYVGALLRISESPYNSAYVGYTPVGLAEELGLIQKAASCADAFIYGWAIDAKYRETEEQKAAATWAEAQKYAIFGAVSNSANAYSVSNTNSIVYYVMDNALENTFTFYHNNPQIYPEVSYLAKALSVDYALANSALTMKFKQLTGIATVPLTETQLNALAARRCNTYVSMGNTSQVVREGVQGAEGWFTDSRVNLDNFVNELQTAIFNVFLRNPKVPYTSAGQDMLVSAAQKICSRYEQNGVFAARTVEDNATESGYTTYPATQITPTPVYQATASERASREGMPIQITAYEAGAMHRVNVNVTVEA